MTVRSRLDIENEQLIAEVKRLKDEWDGAYKDYKAIMKVNRGLKAQRDEFKEALVDISFRAIMSNAEDLEPIARDMLRTARAALAKAKGGGV